MISILGLSNKSQEIAYTSTVCYGELVFKAKARFLNGALVRSTNQAEQNTQGNDQCSMLPQRTGQYWTQLIGFFTEISIDVID